MSKLLMRRKTLLAKIETTYGVDAGPTGATNAIQTKDLEISPLEGDSLAFDVDTPSLGAKASTMVGKHVMVTFKVPAAGAGAAGTAPAYAPLLKACGHTETITAGTDVTYAPGDIDTDSVTLWVMIDRTLHAVVGSRGSVKMSGSKRQYPWFEFSFMGLFATPTDQVTSLAPAYAGFKIPLPYRFDTVDFSLGAYKAGLHEITIDFGQKVEFYEHSEEEQIMQINREATWQGVVEEPSLDVKNFYADISADTKMAFNYQHGTTAGNIVEVAALSTQLLSPKRQAVQDIAALSLSGPFIQAGVGSEYSIIVR